MTPADEVLEQQIDLALKTALAGETPDAQRAGFAAMALLIKQRSDERVAEMERERGLRA